MAGDTCMVLKGCSVKFTTMLLFLKTSGEALPMVLAVCVSVCARVHVFALAYNLTGTLLRYEHTMFLKVRIFQF